MVASFSARDTSTSCWRADHANLHHYHTKFFHAGMSGPAEPCDCGFCLTRADVEEMTSAEIDEVYRAYKAMLADESEEIENE